ncbi:hypothetical protein HNP72_003643 [Sphingobacterium soli]|nr:hypothetical protein [Sphingobacterium soli]
MIQHKEQRSSKKNMLKIRITKPEYVQEMANAVKMPEEKNNNIRKKGTWFNFRNWISCITKHIEFET